MLSKQEQAEMAEHLRSTTVVPTELPEDLVACLDVVDHEEMLVPTRIGLTRTIMVKPRDTSGALPLFINFHGGGFVRGYQERDTIFCAMLASKLGCVVIDVDYRLSPEYPFPTALHEAHDVVQFAFSNAGELGIDPARIAIGGHSAGGNLTAAVCLMIKEEGGAMPCLQILDYPFLDAVTDSFVKIGDDETFFTPERLDGFNILHVPKLADRRNPLMSPVLAKPEMLEGLPSALIIIAAKDILRHEAECYARMLVDAGVEVRLRKFLQSDHGFIIANLAEYRQAHALILKALKEAFGLR